MSTEVIDLGSSDDEREPEPKKKKIMPNAMVNIPGPHTKLPEITIRPTKYKNVNPLGGIKLNVVKTPVKNFGNNSRKLPINHSVKKVSLKPVLSNKIITNKCSNQIGTRLLKTLPPSITIKKASDSTLLNIPVKKAIQIKKPVKRIVQIVEIDDDAPASSRTLPQWYKTPEELLCEKLKQVKKTKAALSLENKNNEEPSKFIEITIDDSPVKPSIKHNEDISNAIYIEDSPDKGDRTCKEQFKEKKEKQSKKMLNYEKAMIVENSTGMIEVEVEPIDVDKLKNNLNSTQLKTVVSNIDLQKITQENLDSEKTKKNNIKENLEHDKTEKVEIITKRENENVEKPVDNGEFNAIYQKFIDTCFNVENSNDMQFIVEKKIKVYYKQCPKEYVDSEEFLDFISGKVLAIESSPKKMYNFIRDVVEELKTRRKGKTDKLKTDSLLTECSNYVIDTSECDSKLKRQITKLEKTLMKLRRSIQKLEEQEVDFDDEENSIYLLTERYKERFVRVYTKFCQLTQTKLPSEPYVKLETLPGRPKGPATKLEKWINKKVSIGKPLPFPDFHDVLRCVREANSEDNLGWSEMEILEEARELFTACGKKLKRRRQDNEWRIVTSRWSVFEDPAQTDVELKKKLDQNEMVANRNEAELLNRFVVRQNLLKLEPEVIVDIEAEESSIESDEEDDNNVSKVEENEEKDLKGLENDEKDNEKSNIDELKIRNKEKYYSESDSDTPMNLTDSENEPECHNSDVISVEDSSYSELENSMNSPVAQMDIELSYDSNDVAEKGNKNNDCLMDDVVVINAEKELKSKSCNTEINNDIKVIDDIETEISDIQTNVELRNDKVAKTSTSIDAEKRNVKMNTINELTQEIMGVELALTTENAIHKSIDLKERKDKIDVFGKLCDVELIPSEKQITDKITNVKEPIIISAELKTKNATIDTFIDLEQTKAETNMLDQHINVEMIASEKQITDKLADDEISKFESKESSDKITIESEPIIKSVELTSIDKSIDLETKAILGQHTDVDMMASEKQITDKLADDEISKFESKESTDKITVESEPIIKSVELTSIDKSIDLETIAILGQHTDVDMMASEKQITDKLVPDVEKVKENVFIDKSLTDISETKPHDIIVNSLPVTKSSEIESLKKTVVYNETNSSITGGCLINSQESVVTDEAKKQDNGTSVSDLTGVESITDKKESKGSVNIEEDNISIIETCIASNQSECEI